MIVSHNSVKSSYLFLILFIYSSFIQYMADNNNTQCSKLYQVFMSFTRNPLTKCNNINRYNWGYVVMLRARMFRSLIPVLMIKERNIRATE